MTAFWIRGQSVAWASTSYLLQKIDTADAVDFGLLAIIATALLYPYNAKFGLISKKMPVKYTGFPNHYVPEVLMTVCESSIDPDAHWLFFVSPLSHRPSSLTTPSLLIPNAVIAAGLYVKYA